MQTVNKKGEREWNNDKSGKKFTSMVITPIFETIKSILNEFLEFKKTWEQDTDNITRDQMDYMMDMRQKCAELLRDLKYEKFIHPVLRVVAPNFHFETYKRSIEIKNKQETKNNSKNKGN